MSAPTYGHTRDVFRSRLYRVEDEVLDTRPVSLEEAGELARAWAEAWGVEAPAVVRGRSDSNRSQAISTLDGPAVIRLAPNMGDLTTLSHEFAHVLSNQRRRALNEGLSVSDPNYVTEPGHGWLFAATLLEHTAVAFDSAAAHKLRAVFDAARIPFVRPDVPNGILRPARSGPTERTGTGFVVTDGSRYVVRHRGHRITVSPQEPLAKVWRTRRGAVDFVRRLGHGFYVRTVEVVWMGRWVPASMARARWG